MLARPTPFRTRDVALVLAAMAISVALGAALARAFTADVLLVPRTDGAPVQPAPAREPAPQPTAPALSPEPTVPASTLAPTTSAAPGTSGQDSPTADATRQPFQTLPTDGVVPSFQPGGNLPPPFASIPPQN